MKLLKPAYIMLLILISIGIYFLFKPSLWQNRIEIFLNDRILKNNKWTLSIGKLEGHVFTTIFGEEVQLVHTNGSIITIPEFQTRVNLISTLIQGLDLERLYLNQIQLALKVTQKKQISKTPIGDLTFIQNRIRIQDLWVEGDVIVSLLDTVYTIRINMQSAINSDEKEVNIVLDELDLVYGVPAFALSVQNTNIKIKENEIRIAPVKGMFSSVPFHGELFFSRDSVEKVSGEIVIENYIIPEKLFRKIPLQPKLSSLSARVHFDSDFTKYIGTIDMSNALGLDMKGSFTIRKYDDHLLIDRIELKSDPAQLIINGLVEYSGRISGNAQLSHLDLSRWLAQQKRTDVSGIVLYEGVLDSGQIDDVSMTVEIQESKVYSEDLISISGTIAYHDQVLDLSDPLTLTIGPSSVKVKGMSNFQSKEMDLTLDLSGASVFLINNFWSDSLESGTATGTMNISGPFNNPNIAFNLTGNNIRYKDFYLEKVEISADIETERKIKNGFALIKLGEGSWKNLAFDNGMAEFKFRPNLYIIENFHVNAGSNYIQISGSLQGEKELTINRAQIAYEGHYLVNTKPLNIIRDNDTLSIKPFELHVDDGIVEGYIKKGESTEGRIKLSNIDSELLSYFIQDDRLKLQGIIFGELGTQLVNGKQDYIIEVSLKNGMVANQAFDDLVVSALVHDKILHIDELTLIDAERTGVQVFGIIPLGSKHDQPVNIDLQSNFKNLDIEILTQFLPEWIYLGGQINGEFNLGGTTEQTTFVYDLSIDNAVFDILPMGLVRGNGYYDGKRLYFSSFSSDINRNHIEGSGFLPLDYNIGSDSFSRFYRNDSLRIDVTGQTTNLGFLTAYLTDVDSITGQFDLRLQLSGDMDRMIRDGAVKIRNAGIHTILLDDPITQLDGEATIVDNQLIIDYLSGKSVEPGSKRGRKVEKNLSVTGGLDLTKFFEPRFDIHTTGREIYFRTLIDDIEGIVDLDVTVKGKDTLRIAGEIAPIDVEMFREFTTEEIITTPPKAGRIMMNYRINFPIKGDFTLINSQIDANIGGEVGISKLGNYPADYAGELFVRDGKFYYYGDVFTINEGYLAFDKKGFNPYLDISAYTTIEGEKIFISLIGPLDNPNLLLDSESHFSPSDILELLTWRKRFEDQDISSAGFGNQAQAILGVWFESQLERNLMQISGLDQLGIVNDVSISGTTGLLNPGSEEDFSIKAELSDKLSLNYAYRRSFSLTNPDNHMVGVELRVNRYMSLVGNVDKTGNFHVKYRLRYSY